MDCLLNFIVRVLIFLGDILDRSDLLIVFDIINNDLLKVI